jgi:transposase InsO family protein
MIKELAASGQRVNELCDLFGISASGYYDWLNREPSERERTDKVLAENIKEIHKDSRKTYGSPRITKALRQKGVKCGKNRAARIMKQNGLQGAQKARYRPRTTDSRHEYPISPNLLENMSVERINQAWASDITYIPTEEGWLYLSAFMDLKSRKIKGWSVRDHMRTELVQEAFLQAIFREGLKPGLVIHSDRGSQYASHQFRDVLKNHKAISSMSGKGNCYDNAAMESFWATLKTDLGIRKPFKTREEARRAIFDYIEIFYNRFRLHSSLGDLSPLDYETKCIKLCA